MTRSDLFGGRGKYCLKHCSTPNMSIQCSVGLLSPGKTRTASSQQYFRFILVCIEANEKLVIWRKQHDSCDPSLTAATSPSCSSMSQILTNKTSSAYLTVAVPSIFMATSKYWCKMMKLLSRFPMGKVFCICKRNAWEIELLTSLKHAAHSGRTEFKTFNMATTFVYPWDDCISCQY